MIDDDNNLRNNNEEIESTASESSVDASGSDSKEPKMEICYTCGKEFDMNSEEGAHYHYDEFPMCGYCSNFYGFYKKTTDDIL